jgi:hypothetical protein
MGIELDIRRIVKAPPESFISSTPVDLLSGDNKVAEYSGFDSYIISIQGLSFDAVDGLVFHMDVDGYTDVVRLDNLSSVRGLDYEESVKIPSARIATMRITAPSSVSAYRWRHRVTVFKPTVALKLQLGLSLTDREKELAERYGLKRLLTLSTPEAFNIYSGIVDWKTIASKITATSTGVQTVARIPVPKGKKVILAGVSAARPTESAAAYLVVNRDSVESTLNLDLYCLPGLSYEAPVRIVALEKLEVFLNAAKTGTYYVRLVYGVGDLTLREKVMWIPGALSSEERAAATAEGLFEKAEAGVE